MILNNLKILKY